MEEWETRRNVAAEEGGQPSGPAKEHSMDAHGFSPRLERWFNSMVYAEERTQFMYSQTRWGKIPKVPQMLRHTQDFEKFYEPRVISFGPYHHGKPHLLQGEMLKPLCGRRFLRDSGQSIQNLYRKIESNIKLVRMCYDEDQTYKYDDEELAWMMLLDGCSLLYFILCVMRRNESQLSDLNVKSHFVAFVQLDCFLLENQLPFGILELLFEGARLGADTMEEMIERFITSNIAKPRGTMASDLDLVKDPSHLLDLLRSGLLGPQPVPEQKGQSEGIWRGTGPREMRKQGDWQSYRNIKELEAAGIYLKPSRTTYMRDISFESYFFFGYLKLPHITIDASTKLKLLNLAAYEMSPNGPGDFGVTSYICFLDSLIKNAEDVMLLQSNYTLFNFLGSDEKVADLFNDIAKDLVPNRDAYAQVKAGVQKHYNTRVNVWISKWLHSNFTFLAFIGAVVALGSSICQTYFAAFPPHK